jgi:lipopolysaccharide/colanic/teichoic acid biosynthesis glycosyltransferase
VGTLRINDVRRLDRYLDYCAATVEMGGYLVLRYRPLENVAKELRRRHPGWRYRLAYLAHFLWYRAVPKIPFLDRLYFAPGLSWIDDAYYALARRRNRALSKAEVWGRLSYYGMHVVAESTGEGDLVVIAQKRRAPERQRMPSYYLVVALEKVGLDGRPMRTHKVRSMYPFSEFLQKRVFEDHGLAATGKFQNDFRLTEYGKFIRKYWLDELPQLYDWLRGDIKLVGMRATSRHFLGLYPPELYELYVQVKPGLVPPIFGEATSGFDQIVEVEMTYLRSYWRRPFFTDARYLWQTFSDIVFRGVRSK